MSPVTTAPSKPVDGMPAEVAPVHPASAPSASSYEVIAAMAPPPVVVPAGATQPSSQAPVSQPMTASPAMVPPADVPRGADASVADVNPSGGPDADTDETTVAAASALGALAAGLAASARAYAPQPVVDAAAPAPAPPPTEAAMLQPQAIHNPPQDPVVMVPEVTVMPASHVAVAAPVMPVAAPNEPAPQTAAVVAGAAGAMAFPAVSHPGPASTAATNVAPATLAPAPVVPADQGDGSDVRSLDDTVAELLRPMLRQWLADNMPRIVEKALRIEVAESLKGGKRS